MTIRNIEALFNPRNIALIGASDRAGSIGLTITRNLLRAGFAGRERRTNRPCRYCRAPAWKACVVGCLSLDIDVSVDRPEADIVEIRRWRTSH